MFTVQLFQLLNMIKTTMLKENKSFNSYYNFNILKYLFIYIKVFNLGIRETMNKKKDMVPVGTAVSERNTLADHDKTTQ